MTGINIPTPTSCATCKFKGDRWCYIEVWMNRGANEVPEEGRPEWCPLREEKEDE